MNDTLKDFADKMVELSDEDFDELSLIIMTDYLMERDAVVVTAKVIRDVIDVMDEHDNGAVFGLNKAQKEMRENFKRALSSLSKIREAAYGKTA